MTLSMRVIGQAYSLQPSVRAMRPVPAHEKCFKEAPQREAPHKRHGGEDAADDDVASADSDAGQP